MRVGLSAKLVLACFTMAALAMILTLLALGSVVRPTLGGQASLQLLGVLLILGFCSWLLGTGTSHAWSKRIQASTEWARRMAEGQFGNGAMRAGHDELTDLVHALDKLSAQLSATFEQLRGERDLFDGILAGMREGILLVDDEGKVVSVNPALREMLLLDANTAGKSPLEIVKHSKLRDLIDEARNSTRAVSAEIEVEGLKPRELLVRAEALRRQPGGLLLVLSDLTDLRRLERVRTEFVANVSHELRTPVTAILSAAETLQAGAQEEPEARAQFIDMIGRNAVRLQALVEDLLDLSRIESRELKLRMESVSIPELTGQVVALFSDRTEKLGVRIQQRFPEVLPMVSCDVRATQQVLSNLIDNAVKYCPRGSTVTLSAKIDSGKLRVSVNDTGPGIAAKHLSRIFERFYRVDAGRSRELGGTGLGLSIVKHLVEAMGGEVHVDTTLGLGTTFYFTLPCE